MSFVQRQINVQFSNSQGTLNLEGYRATCVVSVLGGYNSGSQLQMRIFGMSISEMNEFSSAGSNQVLATPNVVTVSAGDAGGVISQIFQGTMIKSYIDFSGIPEVSFIVSAVSGYYERSSSAAPNSWKGAQNAQDIIQSLAQSIGFAFENKNNAQGIVQNQYTSGSVIQQMEAVARAAALPMVIENGKVILFPNDGARDDVVINVSADNGLVGYPTYWEAGFQITTEFNPLIVNGRMINLTTIIPKANGLWPVHVSTHELSTLTPNGSWFTTAKLSPSNYVPNN